MYNEEKYAKKVFIQTQKVIKSLKVKFEIIIVNDGSTDDTKKIIETINISSYNLKIIHKKNGGFGSAIKAGIKIAKGEWVLCIPADNSLNISEMSLFIKNTKNADLIVSYRQERKGYSKRMLFNSYFLHLLIKKLFRINLKDFTWIHAYKNNSIKKIYIRSNGVFMLPEIIIKSNNIGCKIMEIPIQMHTRKHGKSAAASWKVAVITLIDLVIALINQLYFSIRKFSINKASKPVE